MGETGIKQDKPERPDWVGMVGQVLPIEGKVNHINYGLSGVGHFLFIPTNRTQEYITAIDRPTPPKLAYSVNDCYLSIYLNIPAQGWYLLEFVTRSLAILPPLVGDSDAVSIPLLIIDKKTSIIEYVRLIHLSNKFAKGFHVAFHRTYNSASGGMGQAVQNWLTGVVQMRPGEGTETVRMRLDRNIVYDQDASARQDSQQEPKTWSL